MIYHVPSWLHDEMWYACPSDWFSRTNPLFNSCSSPSPTPQTQICYQCERLCRTFHSVPRCNEEQRIDASVYPIDPIVRGIVAETVRDIARIRQAQSCLMNRTTTMVSYLLFSNLQKVISHPLFLSVSCHCDFRTFIRSRVLSFLQLAAPRSLSLLCTYYRSNKTSNI